MKSNTPDSRPEPAATRSWPLVLAVAFFIMGAGLTAAWFHHRPGANSVRQAGQLSGPTQDLLSQLTTPVAIHYYALLPDGSTSETVQAFAKRVDQLLETVQAATGGKVKISRFTTLAETNLAAAAAAGLQPFNLDKGDACFLGITLAGPEHKEALPRLQPEWEAALEYDLARALLRAGATTPVRVPAAVAKPSAETLATISRLIPDVKTTSAAEADQIFHAEFLKDCAVVGSELEVQINAAQEKVQQAEASGSEADLEAARKNLAQVQVDQADKLKQVAARLQVQLALFKQMKAGTNFAQ